MELVKPSAEYKDSYLAAVKEFQSGGGKTASTSRYFEEPLSELESDFGPVFNLLNRLMIEACFVQRG